MIHKKRYEFLLIALRVILWAFQERACWAVHSNVSQKCELCLVILFVRETGYVSVEIIETITG